MPCCAVLFCAFVFVHTRHQPGICTYVHRITKKHTQVSSAQLGAVTQCTAVRCRALPGDAVLYRAVPCRVVLSVSHISEELCTYMQAASGLFSWSRELLAFSSRPLEPKMMDHLTHRSFRSILLCERITPNSALSLAQLSSAA